MRLKSYRRHDAASELAEQSHRDLRVDVLEASQAKRGQRTSSPARQALDREQQIDQPTPLVRFVQTIRFDVPGDISEDAKPCQCFLGGRRRMQHWPAEETPSSSKIVGALSDECSALEDLRAQ